MAHIATIEIPKQINKLVEKLERGESVNIAKSGKTIGRAISLTKKGAGWKRRIKKVSLPRGISAQSYVEDERTSE
jgi:antitoxin (DNA-binding transcriptional repressor) of toxin-antitoxin stability system